MSSLPSFSPYERLHLIIGLADSAYALADRWDAARSTSLDQFTSADIKSFNSNQVALFLDTVQQQHKYGEREIGKMNSAYGLEASNNDEIRVSHIIHLFYP